MLFSLRKLALASAIFLPFINAQTVTVTERRNVCNAPGYRGPSSLASPAAYPSAAANNSVIADGTSFVIRIGQNVNGAPTYIAADGMTTSNKADAILFDIIDGQLASTGGFMSTGPVITDQLFTISRDSGAITGKFSMVDGALVWQNSAFGLGTAQFYIQPATTAGGPDYVYIRFTGLPTPGQYRVTLYPDTDLAEGTGSMSGGSPGHYSTTYNGHGSAGQSNSPPTVLPSGGASAYSDRLPVSSIPGSSTSSTSCSTTSSRSSGSAAYGTPSSSLFPSSEASGISSQSSSATTPSLSVSLYSRSSTPSLSASLYSRSSTPPSSSTSTSPLSSSSMLSSNSIAGSFTSTPNSASSSMASSSSSSSSDTSSNTVSSSAQNQATSSISSSAEEQATSSITISSSSLSSSLVDYGATTSTLASSTSTVSTSSSVYTPSVAPVPIPASCDAYGGTSQVIMDNNGVYYQIQCSADTNPQSIIGQATAPNSYSDCFALCDNYDGCTGFSYAGQPEGVGAGQCYFKTGDVTFTPSSADHVGAIRISPGSGQAGSYAPSSSLSTSSLASIPAFATTSSVSATSSAAGYGGYGSAPSSTSSATLSLAPGQPTPCTFGDPNGTNQDDSYCEIDLPFQVLLSGVSSSKTFPSTNGILSLDTGSAAYDAGRLPDSSLPPSTLCPLFSDLYIAGSRPTNESITYLITTPDASNNIAGSVNYTFTLSRGGSWESYIFSVYYTTSTPGTWLYEYFVIGGDQADGTQTGNGSTASVGYQGLNAVGGPVALQYSYQQSVISPGLHITCDTIGGTCRGSDGSIVSVE